MKPSIDRPNKLIIFLTDEGNIVSDRRNTLIDGYSYFHQGKVPMEQAGRLTFLRFGRLSLYQKTRNQR